jgi:peptide/nickel transport system substrate-binding protein
MITSYLGSKMTFTAVDDYTLDVTTEAPDPLVPVRLYVSPISSMEAYKKNPQDDDSVPVGTGPYKFVKWDRGQQVVIEKNPDWWGLNSPDGRGKPYFDQATFAFRAESTVRTDMVNNGEADLAEWISADDCKQAPVCHDVSSVETLFMRPDDNNALLGDLRVRQAIAMSFDKQQLLDVVLGGGVASAQIVGPAAAGFNTALKPAPYDLAKAKSLIEDARKAGVPVDTTISLMAQPGLTSATDQVIEVLAGAMRNIGLKVDTKNQDHDIYIKQMREKPIPADRAFIFLARHGNEFMDYSVSVDAYYTCAGPTSGYCDPKLEQMVKDEAALSGDARVKAMQDIAAYVDAQQAAIVIGQLSLHFGTTEALKWTPRLDGLMLLKEMSGA